jgi:hypothetical protein
MPHMANGNSELRAELFRLALPPERVDLGWLDVQVREMEALNERILAANLRGELLHVRPGHRGGRRQRHAPWAGLSGKQFVESLLAHGDLREVEGARIPSSSIFATARRSMPANGVVPP